MDGVIGAEAVASGQLRRVRDQLAIHLHGPDFVPKIGEQFDGDPMRALSEALADGHSGQRGVHLNVGKSARDRDPSALDRAFGNIASRLVDQQLDEGVRIEIERQRRPSDTYSAAVLPFPRSFTRVLGTCALRPLH